MPLTTKDLTLPALREAYKTGKLTPTTLCEELLSVINSPVASCTFITKPVPKDVLERCKYLESLPVEQRGPLWGIPFGVKDNIDVAGYPTTCACPDFSYTPDTHARAVSNVLAAGGIFMGKTNLDQFACGLVGTRTPYGIPGNAFDDRFTPGGSSSGSAVAVAKGMMTFAFGTDTAGSGRVPAGQNGIIGIKPSLGRISTTGVVPACYLLDCVSVFALTVEDGHEIATIMENKDIADPTYRPSNPTMLTKSYAPKQKFKFAVPQAEFLDFSGPGGEPVRKAMEQQMADAVKRLKSIGGEQIGDFDFKPFADTAVLLYGAAFVAERYSGIRTFLEARAPGLEPPELADLSIDQRLLKVTRSIIAKTENWSAADVFKGLQELTVLRAAARVELEKIDVLVVPTAAYNYTVREIMAEEDEQDYLAILAGKAMVSKNANLGRFTNFVNLLDMCGVSVFSGLMHINITEVAPPAKKSKKGDAAAPVSPPSAEQLAREEHLDHTGNANPIVPFGITMLAPAWADGYVAGVAGSYSKATGLEAGPVGHRVKPYATIGTIRPRKSSIGGHHK